MLFLLSRHSSCLDLMKDLQNFPELSSIAGQILSVFYTSVDKNHIKDRMEIFMLNAKCVNLMIIMPSQVFIHKKSCFLRMFKEVSCTRIFIYLLLTHDERIFQEESSLKFDSLVSQLPLKMTGNSYLAYTFLEFTHL